MRAVLLLLLAMPAFADDKADLKAMAGNWTVEKAEIEGVDQTAIFKDVTLVMDENGKYSVTISGVADKGTCKIDSSKTPKQLDITGDEGPNKGKKYVCIYEYNEKEKTMKICYSLDDKTRPAKFESGKDSKTMLISYKKK